MAYVSVWTVRLIDGVYSGWRSEKHANAKARDSPTKSRDVDFCSLWGALLHALPHKVPKAYEEPDQTNFYTYAPPSTKATTGCPGSLPLQVNLSHPKTRFQPTHARSLRGCRTLLLLETLAISATPLAIRNSLACSTTISTSCAPPRLYQSRCAQVKAAMLKKTRHV
jgi:hypothetical protein